MKLNNLFEDITAYHGSPYEFDTFDVKYLGNGEGHQVHGYGLYFALKQSNAFQYSQMDNLDANGSISFRGKSYELNTLTGILLAALRSSKSQFKDYIEFLLDDKEWIVKHQDLLPKLKKLALVVDKIGLITIRQSIHYKRGQFYTVKLPDKKYYIKEREPLEKQSKYVQKALSSLNESENLEEVCQKYNNAPNKEQAQKLYSVGIKGVLYKGNRDGNCVVIFNDKDVKLLFKDRDYSNVNKDMSLNNDKLEYLKSREWNYDKLKIKANEINNLTPNQQKKLIQYNPKLIKFIDNPSIELQEIAVKAHITNVRYINHIDINLLINVLKKIDFYEGIVSIYKEITPNLSHEQRKQICKMMPMLYSVTSGSTKKDLFSAIEQEPNVIRYIKNPSNDLITYAIQKDPSLKTFFHM